MTTIRISRNTRAYLVGRGKKGETFDAIVWKMIEAYDKLQVMLTYANGLPLVPEKPYTGNDIDVE